MTGFLMGARDRLLPASIPFRFFGLAMVFHVGAWLFLAYGARDVPGFAGGGGPVLAALHLLTLGVLAMTAIGASFQIAPVALGRPLRSEALARLTFWLFAGGVFLFGHGVGSGHSWGMASGGGLAVLGLGLYAALFVDALRKVRGVPAVRAHQWVAMASLAALAALGLLLVHGLSDGGLENRAPIALAHAVVAAYGFMGMLVFGFSHILVPMFALAAPPPARIGTLSASLAAAALVVAVAGLLGNVTALVLLGAALGLGAAGVHLYGMRTTLRGAMRSRLDASFVLIRFAWLCLPVSLLLGAALALTGPNQILGPLFGFVMLVGWLLSFVTGVLQKIMPFLASMNTARIGGKPALVSALADRRLLGIHRWCHLAGFGIVVVGILAEHPAIIRGGAVVGMVGALAFAGFGATLWRRYRLHFKQEGVA